MQRTQSMSQVGIHLIKNKGGISIHVALKKGDSIRPVKASSQSSHSTGQVSADTRHTGVNNNQYPEFSHYQHC